MFVTAWAQDKLKGRNKKFQVIFGTIIFRVDPGDKMLWSEVVQEHKPSSLYFLVDVVFF